MMRGGDGTLWEERRSPVVVVGGGVILPGATDLSGQTVCPFTSSRGNIVKQ